MLELKAALQRAGYTDEAVRQLLGVSELSQLLAEDVPAYFQRCLARAGELALWTCLWQLHQRVPRADVEALVGPQVVDELLGRSFLLEAEGILEADVDLTPCDGLFLFTDPQLARRAIPDRVYQLGIDSLVLPRLTPLTQGRALDLCTGSGVQALLAARRYTDVTGVDLNPKALTYARINAELNELPCRFIESDLYAGVEGRFDLILANPPFVPTPETGMEAHRTGGESGEEIVQRLVAGLPEHLSDDGLFAMVLDYPIVAGQSYPERVARWVGQPGWGVAVLNLGNEAVEPYIRRHIDPLLTSDYVEVYRRYLESYARQQIVGIGFAVVFVQRHSHGFAVERYLPAIPKSSIVHHVEAWLRALKRRGSPIDWDWKPAWTPLLGDVWLNRAKTRGILDTVNLEWSGPMGVDGDEARLVTRIDGQTSADALARWWARQRRLGLGQARQEVSQKLSALCEALVCR